MLHMIVSEHNPESCAFRGEREEEVLRGAIEKFREMSPEADIELRGWWINRNEHAFFILAEAPNAHVVEDAVVGSQLVGLTHTRILPVKEVDVLMEES